MVLIVLARFSGRWAGDWVHSLSSPLFFQTVVVTLLFASFPPSSTPLLSFLSVDEVRRTELKEALFFPSSNAHHWSPQPHTQSRGKGRRGRMSGERPDRSPRHSKQKVRNALKRNAGAVMASEKFWNSVLIFDEHELDDDVNAGKTRIHRLPEGRQVSSFLNRGMNGRYLFANPRHNGTILVVIIPCNSIVSGGVSFLSSTQGDNGKIYVSLKHETDFTSFRTQRTITFRKSMVPRGVYMLKIKPIYSQSYVHLFLSTSPDFVSPMVLSINENLPTGNGSSRSRTQMHTFLNTNQVGIKPWVGAKRLRGNRIQVKWDPSPFNPHRMHYCIVVNTRRDYNSLCGATGDKYGVLPPDLRHLPIYPYYPEQKNPGLDSENAVVKTHPKGPDDDIFVGCIRRKTNYILTDLQEGRLYYFNVFVKDVETELSYPYVRTLLKYRTPKTSPNHLRDARPLKARLGSETVTLHFKVKKPCMELSMYIMPCGGGSISFKLLTANQTLYEGTDVDSLDIIKMAFPRKGMYYIQVDQAQAPNHALARMAEVYVSKRQKKFPLPKLPAITRITEIATKKSCDSVTIQFHASPVSRDNEYCIFLKEENRKRELYFKKPQQCDVERSLQSDPYVSHSFCVQKILSESTGNILTQSISGLQPARVYVLQMILRRHNGKSLSYDITSVATSPVCLEK